MAQNPGLIGPGEGYCKTLEISQTVKTAEVASARHAAGESERESDREVS